MGGTTKIYGALRWKRAISVNKNIYKLFEKKTVLFFYNQCVYFSKKICMNTKTYHKVLDIPFPGFIRIDVLRKPLSWDIFKAIVFGSLCILFIMAGQNCLHTDCNIL